MASATAKTVKIEATKLERPSRPQHEEGLPYAYIGRRGEATYVDRPFAPQTPADQVMENRMVAALRILGPNAKVHTLTRLLSLDHDQVEATLARLIRVGRVESLPGKAFRLRTPGDAR